MPRPAATATGFAHLTSSHRGTNSFDRLILNVELIVVVGHHTPSCHSLLKYALPRFQTVPNSPAHGYKTTNAASSRIDVITIARGPCSTSSTHLNGSRPTFSTVALTSSGDTIGQARSDSAGRFAIPTPAAGAVVVHFVRLGYRADSLAASIGNELPLRVAMDPVGHHTLAAVVVQDSARSDFERRARRNAGGTFITAAEIDKRKPHMWSDLLRTIPGVGLIDSAGSLRLVSLRTIRHSAPSARTRTIDGESVSMPVSQGQRCILRVGIDGELMSVDYSIDFIKPSEIRGIEVYLGAATIPIAFSTVQEDAPCGIVMIWIKRNSFGR